MDLVQVLDRLAKTAAEVLAAEAAEVLLLDERHSRLTIEAVFGLSRSNFGLDLGRAILDKGLPVIVQNAQTDPLGDHLPKVFHSALGVPLRVPGRPLGTLHVYGIQPAQFGPGEIERLQAVADLGAIAIETAQGLFDLESMDSSKSQFIRVATHELRSPITVAQSMLGTVVKGYAGPMTETQREIFARIAGRLNFLENLVNDLLQLAASKAPGFTEDECAVTVNASLGRVVLLLQPRAEEKGVALVHHACCDKLAVWASEEGLDRIFVNLVGNAVKYTPPGGRVDVWLGQSPGTPGQSPGTPGQSPGTPGQSPGTPG
ncbi:MAG: GAF domain-containing sensor histidine kinase, partial [Anaerolineae bacterium]|nr:GAF domain-containing sensor histidine kinase [Anaerolineae bacterium]